MTERLGDEAIETALAVMAIKQSVVALPSGEKFVAIPIAEHTQTDKRVAGRHYIELRDEKLVDQLLKFAPGSGWNDEDDEGKKKSPQRIKAERTLVATGGLILDATAPCSFVDSDRKFHLRCWEQRRITAQVSDDVNEWLDSFGELGGNAIRDFVAHCRDLSRPSPALAIIGSHGCGKDLVGLGISALFRADGGPCSAARAANNFNADLRHTPVVVASERLPAQWNGAPFDVNLFKELISGLHREINAKNAPPVKQIGATRWVIPANDPRFLESDEPLDRNNLDALLARLLVVEAPLLADGETSAPAEHLANAGGFEHTGHWLTEADGSPGALVRHFAHLVLKHEITRPDPSGRFGIQSHAGKLRGVLATGSRVAQLVIAGVVGHVSGDRFRNLPVTAVRVGGGRVVVQIGGLLEAWSKLVAAQGADANKIDARRMAPPAEDFAAVVSETLAEPLDTAVDGDARVWKSLRLDLLFRHATALGLDVGAMRARIDGPEGVFTEWRRDPRRAA